jgi:DNA-binding NarL/FixJ family response regulator
LGSSDSTDAVVTEVSVLLVEDDAMVRDWIRLSLEGTHFRLAGIAASAAEAHELVKLRRPQLLLIDYRLPDGLGTELVRGLRRDGISASAVLMTANTMGGFNESAREAGAQGSFLKSGVIDELLRTLRAVADGRDSFDVRHPKPEPGRRNLSPREREVVRLMADGQTNRQIAKALELGEETVKTLVGRAFDKLGVRRRTEAVSEAHRRGLL